MVVPFGLAAGCAVGYRGGGGRTLSSINVNSAMAIDCRYDLQHYVDEGSGYIVALDELTCIGRLVTML